MKKTALIILFFQFSISSAFILPAPDSDPPEFTIYNAVTIISAD